MNGVRNPRPGGLVMTIGEVAAAFGVSRRTVGNWMDAGVLPGFRVPATRPQPRRAAERRFRTADVRAFARREGLPLGRFGLPPAVLAVARGFGLSVLGDAACWPRGEGLPPVTFAFDPWVAAEVAAERDVRGVAIDRDGLGWDVARVVWLRAECLPGAPPRLVLVGEDDPGHAWAGPGVTVLRCPCDPAAVAAWRAGLAEGGGPPGG